MEPLGEFTSVRPALGLMIAQTIGITASTYLLGQNASLSFISIPAVMEAPAPLAAKQWHKVLKIGGGIGIPLAAISALATAYVAFQHDNSSKAFKLNLAATILVPSIVPFTLAFIQPINNKLIEKMNSLASSSLDDKAVEAGVAEGETTHALLDKWATFNLGRAALVAAGSLCAILAAVEKWDIVSFQELKSGAGRM